MSDVKLATYQPDVLNPVGIMQPDHLGQMFIDPTTEVFYQARGLSAYDWRLVTPAELTGSFVKIFDFFLGPMMPPPEAPEHELRRRVADAEAVRRTMALDGVAILQAFAWRAGKTDVMMTRLRFDRIDDISMFVGFAPRYSARTMPDGSAFTIDDGMVAFGPHSHRIARGDTVLLRVELMPTPKGIFAAGYIDDEHFGTCGTPSCTPNPVIGLFDRGDGPRKTDPDYPMALKRNLER